MTCSEVARLQEAFLALELDPATEADVRLHLHACAGCRTALGEAEPAVALALRLAEKDVTADTAFVGEVLAGVHQRAFERRFAGRRRRWLAVAAALALTVLGGWAVLRQSGTANEGVTEATRTTPLAVEPAFVEVEGDGVRLYQFDASPQGAVKVAFIVDPQLEL